MEDFKDDKDNKPDSINATSEDAQIEKEMQLAAEQFAKNSEFVENNLVVIQKTTTKIDDFPDKRHKAFLKHLYGRMKYKQDFALASLIKGLLQQNKLFFSTTKDSIIEAVADDPDNTDKSKSVDMKPFCALMAKNGICQLFDAVVSANPKDHKVAGFVVLNPLIRSLLNVDKDMALQQFKDLKKLSGNQWVTEDMVFNSCGELRVTIDEHRVLVEERRTKGSEPTVKAKEVGLTTVEQKVATNLSPVKSDTIKERLSDFLSLERIQLLKGWYQEGNGNYELFRNAFEKYMADDFMQFIKLNCQITEIEFKKTLSDVLRSKDFIGFSGTALTNCLTKYANECDQFTT